MTHIRVIPPSEATGELGELYRRYAYPDGTVDESFVALSLNPALLHADAELYRVTMYAPGGLSRAEREMIAVLASMLNGCRRCVEHHAASLLRLLPPDRAGVTDALAAGESPALTCREKVILDLARSLTTAPNSITRADIDAARTEGLTDEEILDLANVASYFAYANRMTLGLGVDGE